MSERTFHDCCVVLKEASAGRGEGFSAEEVEAAAQLFLENVKAMARAIAVQYALKGAQRQRLLDDAVGIAFRALFRFDPTRGRAESYIYKALCNEAIDLRRSPRERSSAVVDPAGGETPHPAELVDEGPVALVVLAVLSRWSVRDRLAFCLCLGISDVVPPELWDSWCDELGLDWDLVRAQVVRNTGKPDREQIAELLGVSRGALDKVVSRLRSELGRRLGRYPSLVPA